MGENLGDAAGAVRHGAEPRGGAAVKEYPVKGSVAETVSRILSFVLNPFFVPVYAIAILLFGYTIMMLAPMGLKLYFLAVAVLGAVIIPFISIGLMRVFGLISDVYLRRRQDRTIPLGIVALSYGVCVFMVSDVMWGFMIRKFFMAAFCCSVAAMLISFRWQISVHMLSAGGATALITVLAAATENNGFFFIPLCAALLLSGLLGSARLYLGRHNLAQVLTGFLIGFAITVLVMFLVK